MTTNRTRSASPPLGWPLTFDDVLAARDRIAPHLPRTALRRYAPLDDAVGRGIRVYVKHENHLPTNAFKVRNAVSLVTALSDDERRRGVVAATRGNHGLGLAWACSRFGAPVTICVPLGNNPDKNTAIRGYGAELVEEGADYDASVDVAKRIAKERGMRLAHSTNDRLIVAGAATYSLEVFDEEPGLDAMVIAVGGGSQAVGALTVARARGLATKIYGVQAAGAKAIHDAWHGGPRDAPAAARTFADGLATRGVYELTFDALRAGLSGFITVSEREMSAAVRLLLETTHNLAEGAGAAGLAGLLALRDELAGKRVGIVLSGANIDRETLRKVLDDAIG